MFKQRSPAWLATPPCRAASRLAILLTGPCAMVLFFALATQAQTHSNQPSITLPYHHFSGASAAFSTANSLELNASIPNTDPVPIPGGLAPGIHIFAPGPTELGFMGLDIEPNGITNFNGFSALGYLGGMATDSNNNSYVVSSDMRLYSGEYVSADGTHHRGTFVFI